MRDLNKKFDDMLWRTLNNEICDTHFVCTNELDNIEIAQAGYNNSMGCIYDMFIKVAHQRSNDSDALSKFKISTL